jgi:hypothetical protein
MIKIIMRLFVFTAFLTFGQAALATQIIIDNESYLADTRDGDWTTSTAVSGFIGTNYEYASGNGGFWMDYRISSHEEFFAGLWTIEMNWTSDTDRATNTPVFVARNDLGDYDSLFVDQTEQDGGWYTLGNFMLNIGSWVSIDTSGAVFTYSGTTDGLVIADAFRFTSVSVSEPGALVLLGLGLIGLVVRRRITSKNITVKGDIA